MFWCSSERTALPAGAERPHLVTVTDWHGWQCSRCGRRGSARTDDAASQAVTLLEERLERLLRAPAPALEALEQFLAEALWPRGPLHDSHHAALQAKLAMTPAGAGGGEGE